MLTNLVVPQVQQSCLDICQERAQRVRDARWAPGPALTHIQLTSSPSSHRSLTQICHTGLPTLPLPLGHPWPLPAQQQQQQPSTSPSHMSGLIQAASQLGLPLPGRSCQVAGMKPSSAPGSICMLLSDNASNGSGSRSSPDKSSEARDRSSAEKTAQEGEDEYRRMRRYCTA